VIKVNGEVVFEFCKSVGSAFEGSNPPLPRTAVWVTLYRFFYTQPVKATARKKCGEWKIRRV
jgi:hypothetical protein